MPRPAPRSLARFRRAAGLGCAALLGVMALPVPAAAWPELPGWSKLQFRSQSPDETEEADADDPSAESGTTLDVPLIGQYVTFGGLNLIEVRGVGLVVGLDATGEDPPPSGFRTELADEMRKRGVTTPNEILRSPNTALVVVRAYIPPIVRKGDTFDIEVQLPPNSEATSLAGGFLLECRMAEQTATGGGRVLEGHSLATAAGPVLVAAADATAERTDAGTLRRGRVLGGGMSKTERDLSMHLRNEFRLGRNSVRIAEAIGKRFHGHDPAGLKVPMAEAKTDGKIELKVPDAYRENSPRYLQVIRNIPLRETAVAQRVRLQRLERQLTTPETSEVAALRLEAIGTPAAAILKRGVNSADPEVRFNSAMSLTYLGEPDGLAALATAIREEPAFRVYACAAMASSREAEASGHLRDLLGEESTETRYGAFRALTVINEDDPAVAPELMSGGYKLHVLDTAGPPMVHLTHHSKAEVVLFGANQELRLPAVLRAGRDVLVACPPGSTQVSVSRFGKGKDQKKTVPPRLAEVIRACDELGATYPDIAAMLTQADRQHNLPGPVAIDALPAAGRVYTPKSLAKNGKAGETSVAAKGRTIGGGVHSAPELFAPPDPTAVASSDQAAKSGGNRFSGDATGAVRTADASGEEDFSGDTAGTIAPAGFETDAQPKASRPKGDSPFFEDKRPWYDPKRIFKRPGWIGGPPDQWEPGSEE